MNINFMKSLSPARHKAFKRWYYHTGIAAILIIIAQGGIMSWQLAQLYSLHYEKKLFQEHTPHHKKLLNTGIQQEQYEKHLSSCLAETTAIKQQWQDLITLLTLFKQSAAQSIILEQFLFSTNTLHIKISGPDMQKVMRHINLLQQSSLGKTLTLHNFEYQPDARINVLLKNHM